MVLPRQQHFIVSRLTIKPILLSELTCNEIRDHSVNMVNCFGEDELKIEFGKVTEDKDKIAQVSLDKALKDVQQENVDIIVTAPVTFSDGTSQADYISQKLNGSF